MAELYYFPLMAGDWLAGEAVAMMTPEQEGAFIHLLCVAWQSKELACSLPNDDARLAQLSRLGDRWPTVGVLVREQFVKAGKGGSRLRNPKLWAVYQEFQAKHARRVTAGGKGGKAKAERKQSSSNARPKLEQSPSSQNHNHNQNQITPTTAGGDSENAPTPAAALASLRSRRIEERTPSGIRYRIPSEALDNLPRAWQEAVAVVGGLNALANADDTGLRVMRGQFARECEARSVA